MKVCSIEHEGMYYIIRDGKAVLLDNQPTSYDETLICLEKGENTPVPFEVAERAMTNGIVVRRKGWFPNLFCLIKRDDRYYLKDRLWEREYSITEEDKKDMYDIIPRKEVL